VVGEVRLGREPLYVSMFGSGFRSVTGQFPEPAVFALPYPAKAIAPLTAPGPVPIPAKE